MNNNKHQKSCNRNAREAGSARAWLWRAGGEMEACTGDGVETPRRKNRKKNQNEELVDGGGDE